MDSKIIEKVKALLDLAENAGASPEEAETAARLAQVLMSKHQIDAAAVEAARAAEGLPRAPAPNTMVEVGRFKVRPSWVGGLATYCCRANGCYVFWKHTAAGYTLAFCGPEDDRTMAQTLFLLLQAQVEACTKAQASGRGRTYINNFRLGMITRLGERLEQAQREAEQQAREQALAPGAPGSALVLVSSAIASRKERPAEIRHWVEQQIGKLRSRSSRSTYDAHARRAGRAAGDRATLRHDRVG